MNKQTSSGVSTLAASILAMQPAPEGEEIDGIDYNTLLDHAKTLAGSAMSQDETPGQATPEHAEVKDDFLTRLKGERADLDARLSALTSKLQHNPGFPNPHHNDMLVRQAKLMSELLAVLDERIADIELSQRSSTDEGEKFDGE